MGTSIVRRAMHQWSPSSTVTATSLLRLSSLSCAPNANCHAQQNLPKTQNRGYKQVRPFGDRIPIPSVTANQPEIPPYPLGPRHLYKQSNAGLYGNSRIRFGNNVSRETEIINPQKTRRKWRPNIQEKRLWSESLGVHIRTRISTRVLRTVDKVGGLDEYLLGSKPARIAELGPWGWRLRWRVMQTSAVQERFRQEREALGLPADNLVDMAVDAAADGASAGRESIRGEMAETQEKIDSNGVFDLAPDDGFMREDKTDGKL